MDKGWKWVLEEDLGEVFRELSILYSENHFAVDGEGMAFALKRLLTCEVAVGGPYKNLNGQIDPVANEAIDTFLRQTGTELPNLRPYRANNFRSVPSADAITAEFEYSKIKDTIEAELSVLPASVRPTARKMWRAICSVDKKNREIGLISTFFARSLTTSPKEISNKLRQLGVANFYIWMAYTIYDDFFDDEGVPTMLPFANISMRAALSKYSSIWNDKKADQLIYETFLGMEDANAWEMAHARADVTETKIMLGSLPRYGKNYLLANRALGHVLGPMLIAQHLPGISEKQYQRVCEGLRQFLVARQLNDDLHDWRKDFQAGHLSPVVTHLLRGCNIQSGQYALKALSEQLERYFWDQGLVYLCQQTLDHVKKCRSALDDSKLVNLEGGDFARLIDRLENAMLESQKIHANNHAFLAAYKSLQA